MSAMSDMRVKLPHLNDGEADGQSFSLMQCLHQALAKLSLWTAVEWALSLGQVRGRGGGGGGGELEVAHQLLMYSHSRLLW